MKYVCIALVAINYLWDIVQVLLSQKQMKKPLPDCVKGIYDDEQYARWVAYTRERRRFGLITGALSTLVLIAIFAFDLLAVVYNAFGIANPYLANAATIAVFCLGLDAVGIIPNYISTFRIEEKYGFNKSTKKTFWLDTLKNSVINLLLTVGLALGAASLYDLLGMWLILGVFAMLVVFLLISSALAIPLQKIFYRFTPLEEGSLRDRINELFVSNGYAVKSIYVMNASSRTTRANAFCAGIGKGKKIALYDNLVNNFTEDEITAVFAHELGHDKYKDTATMTLLQTLIYAVVAVLIGLTVSTPAASMSLGFEGTNVAALVMVLFLAVMEPLMTLLMIPVNVASRAMERRADTFAAKCGLGQPLIDALKRLSRDNLADLNPHPLLSAIGHSHPTVGERIRLIERVTAEDHHP